MSGGYMLSTEDNPYSPVTEFDEWYSWDTAAGYHSLAYLARVTLTSDELSEADQAVAIEQAIDEIIERHAGGFYVKVPVPKAA